MYSSAAFDGELDRRLAHVATERRNAIVKIGVLG
jgi:hypothetical protein